MKKKLSKTAFSLLELIIASMLLIIVLLGIFSVNTVLNNNNVDYGQRYFVKSGTQTTLNHILNNASLAVGSGTIDSNNNPDQGIEIGNAGVSNDPNSYSFCIHQAANNNLINSPSDIWLCYTWSPNYQINYCTFAYDSSQPNRGASSCVGGSFLGTAHNNPVVSFANNIFFMTIQNCLNNAALNCWSNTPPDPVNNPEYSLSGSASPLQSGM